MLVALLSLAAVAWWTTRDGLMSILMVVVLALWPAFTNVFLVAWTEGLAGALMLLHIATLYRYLQTRSRSALVFAAAAVGAAALTRFLGVAAVAVFVGFMVVDGWIGRADGRRLRLDRVVAVSIAVGLPASWMVWSWMVRGSATGVRKPATRSWAHQLAALADEVFSALASVPLLALGAAVVVVGVSVARTVAKPGETAGRAMAWDYVVVQLVVQLMAIVAATSGVAVDEIGPRYLAPTMPLLLVGMALGWERMGELRAHWSVVIQATTQMTVRVLLGASVVGLMGTVGTQLDHSLERGDQPTAATYAGFADSPTVRSLGQRLVRLIEDQGDARLILMSPERSVWQWLAPVQRRALVDGTDLQLDAVLEKGPGWWVDLMLSSSEGETATLSVMRAGPFPPLSKAGARLQRALESGEGPALVVAHGPALKKLTGSDGIAVLAGDRWSVVEEDAIPPYVVYSVHRRMETTQLVDAAPSVESTAPVDVSLVEAVEVVEAVVAASDNPFGRAGRHGIGEGWSPTKKASLALMRREEGHLQIQTPGSGMVMACGPVSKVSGAARVVGEIRSNGLSEDAFVEILVGLRDASGQVLVDPERGQVLRSMKRFRGSTDWRGMSFRVDAPQAATARVCVKVRGASGTGSVRGLRVDGGVQPRGS